MQTEGQTMAHTSLMPSLPSCDGISNLYKDLTTPFFWSCSNNVSWKDGNLHSWYSLWSPCSRCRMRRTPSCLWVPHVHHHAASFRWGLQTHLLVCLSWVCWVCIPGFRMTGTAPEASPLMLILQFTMPSMFCYTDCRLSDQEEFHTNSAVHGINK